MFSRSKKFFSKFFQVFFNVEWNASDNIPTGLKGGVIICVFRGLKAYLSKWKARGFDNDVKRRKESSGTGLSKDAQKQLARTS